MKYFEFIPLSLIRSVYFWVWLIQVVLAISVMLNNHNLCVRNLSSLVDIKEMTSKLFF